MKIDFKVTGADNVLNLLQSLPKEIVSKRGGPVKAALRKGAKVIHTAAAANLQAVTSNATSEGRRLSTGMLLKNLMVTRGKEPTGSRGERYLVRVRRKVYKQSGGENVTTLKTAQLLEYGSSQQKAEPWLVPAFKAKQEAARDTVIAELNKALDRIVKKLAKGPKA